MPATTNWTERFPDLHRLDPGIEGALVERSRILRVSKDTVVFAPDTRAENLLLVLDGTVRVQQTSEGGREIVLYRVTEGETCIMTLACLLGHDAYSAEGIAETDVQAVGVPRPAFEEFMGRSSAFRSFVFASYSSRLRELFNIINDVAFARVDVRLAKKLIELAHQAGDVGATHQQLAVELGSAREVISRQLQEFQRRGWIRAERGHIGIIDHRSLEGLASGN
jgi:CRP/FNR family transcriptional regulator